MGVSLSLLSVSLRICWISNARSFRKIKIQVCFKFNRKSTIAAWYYAVVSVTSSDLSMSEREYIFALNILIGILISYK